MLNGIMVASRMLFSSILLESSSDSDSDSEDDEEIVRTLGRVQAQEKRVPSRIENFVERIVPGFTAKEFQSHYRLNRESYEWLLRTLAPSLEKMEGAVGKNRIPIEKQLLSALWLLATPDSYRSVGLQFNMSKSSLFVSFERVVKAVNSIIASNVVSWPTREERETIKAQFRRWAGLEGVIGAIDGTYVKIKAPRVNPEAYINRKCFHAITLQSICVSSLKFTDCYAGYPSSVGDARIFRNSPIYHAFHNNTAEYFDHEEYIIGDKAYPIFPWCIPPYIDRGDLQNMHKIFNSAQARTRQVIERAFALLFGRFRRLRDLDMNRLDLIPATIIACCTLHNVALLTADELLEQYIDEGRPFVINDDVGNENYVLAVGNERVQRNVGVARRDHLARQQQQRRRNGQLGQ